MKNITSILLLISLLAMSSCNVSQNRNLLNDKWNTSGNVSVKDSVLVLSGESAKAILEKGNYKNFELSMELRTSSGGKGYIGIHTDREDNKGYRIAVNNDEEDAVWWRMTGSLLSVRNLTKRFVKEGEWFKMNIRVEGQAISVKINDNPVVEYIEPAEPLRLEPNAQALISDGVFSLVSAGAGSIEFRKISVETLNSKNIDIPAQLAMAGNEQDDAILRLHQEDFPVLDYHVHLKGGFTKEAAAELSRQTGINYAIAPNCGIGFPITDDAGIYAFLDTMRTQPFILAMQGEGREWVTTFSEKARDEFDFVFTDALTFTDTKGHRTRLWINEEVFIDNEQRYMDMIVDKICAVLQEPANVYVNPFFLPEQMNDRYDAFWTEKRIDKAIKALKNSGMALEINELYNIPSKAIILKAKQAGIKFTFGSNNISPEMGRLEYSVRMKNECGLTAQDMYKPEVKI